MKNAIAAAVMIAVAAPALAAEIAVTRFHTPESLVAAAPGPIAVRAGAGLDPRSPQASTWVDAVAAALVRQGFSVVPDASRVAVVALDRARVEGPARHRSGLSVGVGVGSGGHRGDWGRRGGGFELGLGIGFLLGGSRPREVYDTTLAVTIEDASGAHAWEGRAEATVDSPSKKNDPRSLADEMAGKLFAGFPGESGATIGAR